MLRKPGDFPKSIGVGTQQYGNVPYGPNLVDRANIWWIIVQHCYYWSDFCGMSKEVHLTSAKAQLEHSIGRHEIGFCGVGGDVVKCFYGADPLRCVEMVTSNFAVKSTLISLLLLNRQNLFPVSNNMCASVHVASK